MSKPSDQIPEHIWEDAWKDLQLNKIYEDFFSKSEKYEPHNDCNLFNAGYKNHEGAKDICNKFVHFLKKIYENTDEKKSKDYCNYLPYWLYDEIKGKYKSNDNIRSIPFVNDLINVQSKVNVNIIPKKRCFLEYENGVNLGEIQKRKIFYAYFREYENVKSIINKNKKDECSKYNKYINSINLLYKVYKEKYCKGIWLWVGPPKYIDCDSKYDPNNLISILKDCENKEAKRGGNSGFFSLISGLLSPSPKSSKTNSVTSVKGPTRAVTPETKTLASEKGVTDKGTPNGKHLPAAPSSKDNGVTETSKGLVVSRDSSGSASRGDAAGMHNEVLHQAPVSLQPVGSSTHPKEDMKSGVAHGRRYRTWDHGWFFFYFRKCI
ncbi:hypothetical protein PCYB_005710 [Plasmodium cynomolgi strain B]|uniref:CYIR protein n=1 Tax=Plasmodium cynomolgi (strain B) TaxID=1120755 RepID=K6VK53_PLACD|nr:hypothetical protein PCYB_005710 [Plasmodium cynomolgi strain B]GAB69822.1 hypothetical protein PCYB_005710 [Plasmodium cynomolgi strain B]